MKASMNAIQEDGSADAKPGFAGFGALTSHRFAPAIGLALLWCIPALVIGFAGEIALNDDFAYAWAVRALLEDGRFERLPVTWVPVVVTTYWGALFGALGGFSFAALRLSSWVAGGLGIWATHRLLRECGVARGTAFLGAALLAVNPVYVNLAFTFMTDVPFMALTTASLAAFVRNLRTGSWRALILGTVLAIAAMLTRQVGFALPLAFGLALLIGTTQSHRLLRAIGVGISVALPYVIFVATQSASGGPEVYSVSDLGRQMGTSTALWHGGRHTLQGLVLLGAFIAPLALWFRTPGRGWLWFGAGVIGILAGLRFFELPPMPWMNIIRPTGLGVQGMDGEDLLVRVPMAIRWTVTVLASGTVGLAAGSVIGWLVHGPASRARDPRIWLLIAFSGASLAPYVTRSPFFDRYALSVLPAVIALCAVSLQGAAFESGSGNRFRVPVGFATGLVALLCWLSTAGTYGSMECARAQLAVLEGLQAEGVPTTEIDGGRAWNAWTYDWATMPRLSGAKRYFVMDDVWVVNLRESMEGYRRVSTTEYARGLSFQPGRLYLHRRIESKADAASDAGS